MKNLFWDLDGTLVDSRRRLYELFCYLTDTEWLSYEQYWDYKNKGYNQQKMLSDVVHYRKTSLEEFSNKWMDNIEKVEWLKKDTLQPGAENLLKRLKEKGYAMFVVTNRQSHKNTVEQLHWLGILPYFESVYATAQKCRKSEIIRNNISVKAEDILIGDSDEDMIAAQELGITSIIIKSGQAFHVIEHEQMKSYTVNDYDGIWEVFQ
ncbi:MAG: HAD hydrolase-like protein [Clostridium sp.]|nr:HAD hydrolase-like protein [Clostridium sp.]